MKVRTRFASWVVVVVSVVASSSVATHAADLSWDANAGTAGQTDGAGAWLGTNQWWTGTTNADWTSGDSATFGWGGAGGAVTLASPTTVDSLTFKYFTGTYTLGTAGQAITLNNGLTKIGGQTGVVNIASPLVFAGPQTWTNNSIAANTVNLQAATTLNGTWTVGGNGVINSTATAAVIGGSGDIIKNGTGQFNFSAGGTAPVHTFTGNITVNDGSIGFQASSVLSGRNVHLNGGYLGGRFGSGFTWTSGLGTGANQIQITGGTSGLSGEGTTSSGFQIGSALSTLVWGANGEGSATGFFNPSVFLANGNHRMNSGGVGSLNNGIDLNGATRTITSLQATNGAAASGFTINGAIINGTGTAGLTKTGIGNLILVDNNTFNGATTISSGNSYSFASQLFLVTAPGSITLSGASGSISNTSALNLQSGGTLRMVSTNAQNTVDRINGAAITVTGGGGLSWENTAGANSFAETVGSVTVNSGQFNVNLTTNQTGAGDQTLTLGGLARNGNSALAFSAGGTGPQTSGNKNMIVVTGAGTTTGGEIIGPWATTGTAPNAQTDYAIYSSDYVTAANIAANNDETTWASANNVNFNAATTLTATRTVNTLRYSGAAATLDLGSNNLETTGLLNGGSGLLTLAGTGGLTTPTGGGALYVTTGSNVITSASPVVDNGGAVTLVKSGSPAVTTDNGNIDTSGTLVLNGINTYTGDTIINGGALRIGTNNTANGARLGGASGNYTGNITMHAGAVLWISTNASQTLSGDISGDGALLKTYSGTLTLSGNNTYTGRTSIAPSTVAGAGVLEVFSFNSVNGGTPLMASSSLGAPTTVENGTIDLGGPTNIQGGATLRYLGSGETTDRVVNVQFGSNTSRTIDASGSGLLRFTSAFTNLGGTIGTTTIQLIGTGDGQIDQGLPFAFLNLTKSGAGTWTLGGSVESSGILTVSANGGTLALQTKNALMGGITTYWTAPKVIVNSGGTLAVNVGGTGELDNTDVTTLLTNLGGLGGAINNNGLRSGSTIGFDTTNASGTFTITDNLANSTGTGGGAIGLVKRGTGILALTGTNSYTGATTVSGGTLLINGDNSAATGNVSVAVGALLGGNGTIGGNVTISGSLSPGNSPGVLDFGGALTLTSTANTTMEIDGTVRATDYDGVDVGTALTYDGGMTIDFGTTFGAGNYTFNLFDFTSESGDLDSVTLGGLYAGSLVFDGSDDWELQSGGNSWTFTQSTGNLVFVAVPEPTTLAILGSGVALLGLSLARRRRRPSARA